MQLTNIKKQWLIKISLAIILCCTSVALLAQSPGDSLPKDPGRISVYVVQHMNFGVFYQGSTGGTLILSNNGSRSATGDVVAVNQGVSAHTAIFEVEAIPGIMITLQNGPDITLTGSNGGTMNLHLGPPSPASPFVSAVTPPGRTQVYVGGTLTVGSPQVSTAGVYSGTFSIMFFQQ